MVRVKLKDHGIIQRYRTHPVTWTKQRVETSIRDNAATKTVKVVAAHQLKSGDIQIFTSTTAEAIRIKENQGWVKGLGENAELIVPTYGVIVHDISTNSINIKDQRAVTQQVLADNHTVIPNAEISYIGWLTKEAPLKRASSIVVEFTDPESANAIIYAGMAWEGQIHQCELYDRSCRVMQCFRCYHYCHITTQCNAPQVCGYCAEPHETKHCKQKEVAGFAPRCAVCKDAHTAWSNACPARKKEVQRVERAKQTRRVYWHVPPTARDAAVTPTGMTDQVSGATTTTRPIHPESSVPSLLTTLDNSIEQTRAENFSISVPAIEVWEPAWPQQETIELNQTPEGQPMDAAEPLSCSEPYIDGEQGQSLPLTDTTGEAMQQADDWLNEMSNILDMEWPQQGEETGPSPLTSIATDPRTATRRVYKACRCPEHEGVYDNWPTQDAELTIVKCMKICMYCGKDFRGATELRRHIHEGLKYAKRNLRVRYGPQVTRGLREPGWVYKSRADISFNHLRTRSNRSRLLADGTDPEQTL